MAKVIKSSDGRYPIDPNKDGLRSGDVWRDGVATRKISDGGTGPASRGGTKPAAMREKELVAKRNNRLDANGTFGKGSRDLGQDAKDIKNSFRVGRHIDTNVMEQASIKRAVGEAKASDARYAQSQRFYAENKSLRDKKKGK